MSEQKSLIHHFVEAYDRYRAERRATAREAGPEEHRGRLRRLARHLTPNLGTIIAVAALLLAFPSIAAPLRTPSAPSACLISYQGRLADAEGNPITGKVNIEFRLYDVPTGGVPLWEEFWTGGNAVDVSDGLFSVMLGSINDTLCSAIEGRDELYLGITVGTDSEMEPRVQLGSVPFSMQALTVPDGSITAEKIADGAVTSNKLRIENGLSITGNLTLTADIMLGGILDGPRSYWADYRSYIRSLKEDGVIGSDLCPEGGVPVGVVAPKQSLVWHTGNDICQHNHDPSRRTCVNVHQIAPCGSIIGDYYPYDAEPCTEDFSGRWAPFYWWDGEPTHNVTNNILGSGIGCYGVKYACCE